VLRSRARPAVPQSESRAARRRQSPSGRRSAGTSPVGGSAQRSAAPGRSGCFPGARQECGAPRKVHRAVTGRAATPNRLSPASGESPGMRTEGT
jgi:hypothetical protein